MCYHLGRPRRSNCFARAVCISSVSEEDVDAAVRAARKAFASWSLETGARARGVLLMKVADLLEAQQEEMAKLESLSVGKPLEFAR